MKSLTFSILRLIGDGEFHSGESLANRLSVSRASISNALKGIDKHGLVIHKITGRGYRWHNPYVWLDKRTVLNFIDSYPESFRIEILDSVTSTNSYLLNNAVSSICSNSIIPVLATEFQCKGRGRRGRQWCSGLGDNLTFSMEWHFEQGVAFLSGLSLIVGLAIVRALHSLDIKGAMLKWPNDVLFYSRKLAGILIELQGEMLGPTVAIIGIGLNVRLSPSTRSFFDGNVADVFDMTEKVIDRNILLASLLLELRAILIGFSECGFAHFKREWASFHAYDKQLVSLILPNGDIKEGIVDGIGDDGSLILKTSAGKSYFSVGEISLRKG